MSGAKVEEFEECVKRVEVDVRPREEPMTQFPERP